MKNLELKPSKLCSSETVPGTNDAVAVGDVGGDVGMNVGVGVGASD
jgi:hypothetical protein